MAKFSIEFEKVSINPDFITEADLQEFAQQELEVTAQRLVEANQQGKNADGGALKEYSPSYKKAILAAVRPLKRGKNAGKLTGAKQTKGKNRGKSRPLAKKGGNTKTTLHLTGDLHEGFMGKAKAIANGAELGIQGARNQKIAGYLDGLGFKDFFAIGREDEQRIDAGFEKLVTAKAEDMIDVKKR